MRLRDIASGLWSVCLGARYDVMNRSLLNHGEALPDN